MSSFCRSFYKIAVELVGFLVGESLMRRLNRIEGQVRGIKGMLEKDAYCPDILVQVAAVTAALNSFNKVLMANHIRTCVADDIRAGRDETIDELVNTLQKLMK